MAVKIVEKYSYAGIMYNILLDNGEYLFTEWLKNVIYDDNFIKVMRLDGKVNLVNKKGKIFRKTWFDRIDSFFDNGVAIIKKGEKWNIITKTGKLIFKDWIDCWKIYSFVNGFAIVELLNGFYNYIDKRGNVLCPIFLKEAYDFSEGVARVKNGDKWNYVTETGGLLFDSWLDYRYVFDFKNGFAKVKTFDNRFNVINKSGKLIFNKSFDDVKDFEDKVAIVKNDSKYNYVTTKGTILLNKWYSDVSKFENGMALIKDKNQIMVIDKSGNIISVL